MDGVHVISLGKSVQAHLPVAVEVGVISKIVVDFTIGKTGKMITHLPQVFVQPDRRVFVQVDEDEPFPGIAVDRRQAILRFAETGGHAGFLLGADKLTLVVVGPGMETAGKCCLLPEVVPFTLGYDDRIPPV